MSKKWQKRRDPTWVGDGEGFIELFSIVVIIKEIVVRVRVDEPRAYFQSGNIDYLFGNIIYRSTYFKDHVVLDQHVAYVRLLT